MGDLLLNVHNLPFRRAIGMFFCVPLVWFRALLYVVGYSFALFLTLSGLIHATANMLPIEQTVSSASGPSEYFVQEVSYYGSNGMPVASDVSYVFSSSADFVSKFSPPPVLVPYSGSAFSVQIPHEQLVRGYLIVAVTGTSALQC